MFNKLKQLINNKKKEKEIKNRIENKRKYFEIRGAVIKFYENKDKETNEVNIPAYLRADDILKQIIKTPQDIDFYYNKLLKYKAVA